MNPYFLKNNISFLKSIDFAGILDGTSKTLSVINQAIPIYNQVKPLFSNLRTIQTITKAIQEEPITHTSSIFYL